MSASRQAYDQLPTDQIKVDLNRISRRDYDRFMIECGGKMDEATLIRIIAIVVVSWPYGEEISEQGFLSLGYKDSQTVGKAVSEAFVNAMQAPSGKWFSMDDVERVTSTLPKQ